MKDEAAPITPGPQPWRVGEQGPETVTVPAGTEVEPKPAKKAAAKKADDTDDG